MSSVSTANARNNFSDVINRAGYGKERVILTRRGKPVAAVVPIEDIEFLEELEDHADLEAARKALAEGGPAIPWEEAKRQLHLDDEEA